ncbi:MAG: ribonuclease Y [Patescibacteria group bacterium]|nr:ribonuclease Y [Patescibacteria group bacterium]MDD5491009.1 ribonuclease Y [Patescibacteria group bacterium]
MENLFWFLILLVLALAGFFIGYFIRKVIAKQKVNSAEIKAENLINEAKQKQKEILLESKDKALKIIDDAKREETLRRQELKHLQDRLEKREELFDKKLLDLENKSQRLQDKANEVEKIKQKISEIRDEQIAKLEKIAELSKEEAKNLLLEQTEQRMKDELLARIRKLEEYGSEEVERRTKSLITSTMQRIAASHATETTTTVVNLPSDEMKGRIIGREGRNIKVIEQLTGVEIIVDDTPEAILVSGFNPIRRHLAKRTLDKLITDGRIHPGRIEETVEEAKKELALDIKKAGEAATYEVGVIGLDPKLVQILGRLKYRTSYGQNVLQHSIEVALLSKLLAEELGANVAVALKGGLLHDIGKAVDHEVQGTHTQIGYDIMKKFGLPEEVAYISIAHHEDNPKTLEGIIAKVADAISGARPGARRDTYEQYLQRLGELENVASSFEGIEKVYAIQAGREVRVFVKPEKIDDLAAMKLARDIASKIEDELKYPGEIKVNVIRESRVTEYAR